VTTGDLATILHGTTVATNAVLEKRGARVGLLTSEGFRWILHLAEAWTPGPLFGWMIYEKPEPIAAVEDTRALTERTGADGSELSALDEEGARTAIAELRDRGVEAMTVSLLNSFANPAHERAVAQLVREEAPALPVSISSEVLPEFREYERTVTTVVNAYVSPVLDRYLSNLRDRLRDEGTAAELRDHRSAERAGSAGRRVAGGRAGASPLQPGPPPPVRLRSRGRGRDRQPPRDRPGPRAGSRDSRPRSRAGGSVERPPWNPAGVDGRRGARHCHVRALRADSRDADPRPTGPQPPSRRPDRSTSTPTRACASCSSGST
jgi:hypothetical protein